MSRTRSSVVSPSSTTTIRRPCAARAARRCSTPKRASRSAMLHNDHTGRMVRQDPRQLRTLAVQPGTDLGHDLADLPPGIGDPLGQPGHLTVQIRALIMAGHPRVQHHTPITRRCDINQDRARWQPPKRHRHPILTHPRIRRLRMHTHRPRPRRQLHNNQSNIHSLTNTHIHTRFAEQFAAPRGEERPEPAIGDAHRLLRCHRRRPTSTSTAGRHPACAACVWASKTLRGCGAAVHSSITHHDNHHSHNRGVA